jgi:hypothetical protein
MAFYDTPIILPTGGEISLSICIAVSVSDEMGQEIKAYSPTIINRNLGPAFTLHPNTL